MRAQPAVSALLRFPPRQIPRSARNHLCSRPACGGDEKGGYLSSLRHFFINRSYHSGNRPACREMLINCRTISSFFSIGNRANVLRCSAFARRLSFKRCSFDTGSICPVGGGISAEADPLICPESFQLSAFRFQLFLVRSNSIYSALAIGFSR